MPTTRYGVRVGLSVQKQYSVRTSASPILSNQKRYGVQVENRAVLTKQYPLSLQAYSLRYARSEQEARARRKEREIPASLHEDIGALDKELNDLEIVLQEPIVITTERTHTDAFQEDLELVSSQTNMNDALISQMEYGHDIDTKVVQMSSMDTGNAFDDRIVQVLEQERVQPVLEPLETISSGVERSYRFAIRNIDLNTKETASSADRDSAAVFAETESTTRKTDVKDAEESVYLRLDYVSGTLSAKFLSLESGQVTRPTWQGILSELYAMDSPYMETFEHRVIHAKHAHEVQETHELESLQSDRHQQNNAISYETLSAKASNRFEDVVHAKDEQSKRIISVYKGLWTTFESMTLMKIHESHLSDNTVVTTHKNITDSIMNDSLRATTDPTETEVKEHYLECVGRTERILSASEHVIEHLENNGQIVSSSEQFLESGILVSHFKMSHRLDPLIAQKESRELYSASEIVLDRADRDNREWTLQFLELEKSSYLQETSSGLLHLNEPTEVQRSIVTGLSEELIQSSNHKEKEHISEEIPLVRVKRNDQVFESLLEQMDATNKDGRLVEETRSESSSRVRVDRSSELMDIFRGSLIGSTQLVMHDQQENSRRLQSTKHGDVDTQDYVLRISSTKDGLVHKANPAQRMTNNHYTQMTDFAQVDGRPIPDQVVLSPLESTQQVERGIEAMQVYASKAHTVDSWLSCIFDSLEHSEKTTTQEEVVLSILEMTGRPSEMKLAEETILEGTSRKTTVFATDDHAQVADKVRNYSAHLSTILSSRALSIPEEGSMHLLLPANHQSDATAVKVDSNTLESVSTKSEEYEVDETRMEGALGAARNVDEQRIEATERKQADYVGVRTEQERVNVSSYNAEALLSHNVSMKRADGEMMAIYDDLLPFQRIDNDQMVYLSMVEKGLLLNERLAQNSGAFMHASRLQMKTAHWSNPYDPAHRSSENDAIHFSMPAAERLSENDAIISAHDKSHRADQVSSELEVIDSAKRMDQVTVSLEKLDGLERSNEKASVLDPIEEAERMAINEAFLSQVDMLERRYLNEASFENWQKATRVEKIARLDLADKAERITTNYTELADYYIGSKTTKFGVLVDVESAEHRVIEPAALEEYKASDLFIKKKKKIWLIPARGNHWNNWSGWKKTR